MKRFFRFCLLAAALPLVGCAVQPEGVSPLGSPVVVASKVSLPVWVLNPEKAGYVSVIGAATKQDWGGRDAQYRVALMKARQELAQMVRVQVKSSLQSSMEQREGKVTREADIEISVQSRVDLRLDAARVIEEWVDPQTGELYIWLVTPE